MDGWKSALGTGVLESLLGEGAPSVRYQTLKFFLDKLEGGAELQSAKKAIMKTGVVPAILESMRANNYPETFPNFYRDKYTGLSWQLLILAELDAESGAQTEEHCEYLFANSQERESGGFSIDTSVKYGGGRKSTTIPCLTGNMIYALSKLGYSNDGRVLKAAEWLAENQRYDDGDGAPSSLPVCWGDHSCYMGVVKALKGFAELPLKARSAAVSKSIERGVEFLLKHHVYKQSHDLSKPMKPGWTKFSFPLMYQTDALEMLLILSKLGVRDERTRDALDLVSSKQGASGMWTAQNNLKGKLLVEFDQEEQDKWITLRALRVLKYYSSGGGEHGR